METFLRKYFFTVNLAALFVAALLMARVVNRTLEPKLFGPSGSSTSKEPGRSRTSSSSLGLPGAGGMSGMNGLMPKTGREALKANIFCSDCPPIDADFVSIKQPKENEKGSGPNDPQRSQLRLLLVSTVTSDGDPEWSFAAIKDLQTQQISLFRIGSVINADGVTLESIESAKVFIKNAGKLEYIDMKEPAAAPPPVNNAQGNTGIAGLSAADLAKGVRKLGDNKYEVDRELINKLLGNTAALATTARIVPSQKDGKADGFRVYGIRPGSLWGAIGVENGDTIR